MPARVATPQIPKDRTQGDTCCNKVSKHLKCGEIGKRDQRLEQFSVKNGTAFKLRL